MASLAPVVRDQLGSGQPDPGEESLIILQSLLCLMREKNLLTRADIQDLCRKVDSRARGDSPVPLPCCAEAAQGASGLMHELTDYIGHRYGGKHARS